MRDIKINFWTRQGVKRRVGMRTIRVGNFLITHNDTWIGRKEKNRCNKIVEDMLKDDRFNEINDKDFLFLISEKMELNERSWERLEDSILTGDNRNTAPFDKIKEFVKK